MSDGDFDRTIAQARLLPPPRAILFDWDNTLIDSWLAIQDAQNHTLVAFGMEPWSLEETKARVRGSMRDAFPPLFGERWEEAGEIFYRRFAERHLERLVPLPDAETLLDTAGDGRYLAVVSNKKGTYLRKEVLRIGWSHYFARIVGAHDADRDKPSADPAALAVADGGPALGPDVWFVGDADVDMACAVNAGCTPVLLRGVAPRPGEFDGHQPRLHVNGCMALSMLLRSL